MCEAVFIGLFVVLQSLVWRCAAVSTTTTTTDTTSTTYGPETSTAFDQVETSTGINLTTYNITTALLCNSTIQCAPLPTNYTCIQGYCTCMEEYEHIDNKQCETHIEALDISNIKTKSALTNITISVRLSDHSLARMLPIVYNMVITDLATGQMWELTQHDSEFEVDGLIPGTNYEAYVVTKLATIESVVTLIGGTMETNFTTVYSSPGPLINPDGGWMSPSFNVCWDNPIGGDDIFEVTLKETRRPDIAVHAITMFNCYTVQSAEPGTLYTLHVRSGHDEVASPWREFHFNTVPYKPSIVSVVTSSTNWVLLNVSAPDNKDPVDAFLFYIWPYQDNTPQWPQISSQLVAPFAMEPYMIGPNTKGLTVNKTDDNFYNITDLQAGITYEITILSVQKNVKSAYYTMHLIKTDETVPGMMTIAVTKRGMDNVTIQFYGPNPRNGILHNYLIEIRRNNTLISCYTVPVNILCSQLLYEKNTANCSCLHYCQTNCTMELKSLIPETLYNLSILATNSKGHSYPENVEFSTSPVVPSSPVMQILEKEHTLDVHILYEGYAAGITIFTLEVYDMIQNTSITYCNKTLVNQKEIKKIEFEMNCKPNVQPYWKYRITAMVKTNGVHTSSKEELFLTSQTVPGTARDVEIVILKGDNCYNDMFKLGWKAPRLKDRHGCIKHYSVQYKEENTLIVQAPKELCSYQEMDFYQSILLPTQPGVQYNIKITTLLHDPSYSATIQKSFVRQQCQEIEALTTKLNWMIALVVILCIALVIAVVILIITRDANKKVIVTSVRTLSRRNVRCFRIKNVKNILIQLKKSNSKLLTSEFSELTKAEKKGTIIKGKLLENQYKNRYRDILPFDSSRVVLQNAESDYINASFIAGNRFEKAYIASQGPLQKTLKDFWTMVWEQSVTTIVMLTAIMEFGRQKCEPYWPESGQQLCMKCGNFTIMRKSEERHENFVITTLQVTVGDVQRDVMHYHFFNWPDKTANIKVHAAVEFVKRVRNDISVDDSGPILAHCSAGVGRTGTYIAMDRLYQIFKEQGMQAKVDVFSLILHLREYRMMMVQKEEQYLLIFEFLHHLLENEMVKNDSQNSKEGQELLDINTTEGLDSDVEAILPVESDTSKSTEL